MHRGLACLNSIFPMVCGTFKTHIEFSMQRRQCTRLSAKIIKINNNKKQNKTNR